MKKRDIIYVLVILLLTVGFASYILGNHSECKSESFTDVDSVTYVDTIPYYQPVPKDSLVIRYKTVTLPVSSKDSAGNIQHDSMNVTIPITQKSYKDSTYQAWVSGYEPCLDSIKVFPKNTVITITQTQTSTIYKKKRFGPGVQVGIGCNTNGQISPYIGIGVTYNIFSW